MRNSSGRRPVISQEAIDAARAYIGKTRETSDTLAPEPARKLAALLGRDVGDHLRLCWHWAYFNSAIPPAQVGRDGHEKLGLFLPDVPLPRRMWAAGEIEVLKPLKIGTPATRCSTIEDVNFKEGRTGDLCFVSLLHEIAQDDLSIRERQTIVYRKAGQSEPALRQSTDPIPKGFRVLPDTLLQAYSSITQNGHRIHWDRDFCRTVEGYPDLVVHGPLLATLLAETLVPTPRPCSFSYRVTAPVFATSPVRIVKSPDSARIERADSKTAIEAKLH